jgi:hypothetical protein
LLGGYGEEVDSFLGKVQSSKSKVQRAKFKYRIKKGAICAFFDEN